MSATSGSAWRPERIVELIAGTPQGGGQHRVARALAPILAGTAEVPVEVVNVAGRGGGNGWDLLASTPGDPHRLAITSPTLVTNALLGEASIPDRRLTPIALLCTEFIAFAVTNGSPIEDAPQLIRSFATTPPVTALATARGNVNHIALAQVADTAGIAASGLEVRVFDSARQAVVEVLAGKADVAAVSAASLVPEVEEGTIRVLAVSAPERLRAPFDAVPTWKEAGVPCSIGTWRGLVAAPAIGEAARVFWDRAVMATLERSDWLAELERHLWLPTPLGAEDTGRFHDQQRTEMAAALGALGLRDG